MRQLYFLFILLISSSLYAQQSDSPESIGKKPFILGETATFHSDTLDEDRTINVYLPLNYHPDSSKTYPVIYLLDGSTDEDFIHIAGLVQFSSFSWINRIPESIVIGIANVDRKRDFTYPTTVPEDKSMFPTTGGSAKFISFLEHELKPFVEKNYNVNSTTTIIGQSLGGLLASEILLDHPDMFDNYIIVSPSIWWDNESLIDKEAKTTLRTKKVFIAVGNEGPFMIGGAAKLYQKVEISREDSVDVHFQYFEEQDHGDALHLAVYEAFGWLYKKQ